MLVLVGLVFAIAYGSQRITSDATSLHKADEVLRSSTVVRAQLALGSYAGGVDQRYGSSSPDAISPSIEEATIGVEDVRSGMEALIEDDVEVSASLESEVEDFVDLAEQTIVLMKDGQFSNAQDLVVGDLSIVYGDLVDDLVDQRDSLASSVQSSDLLLAQIGNVARFLVAFLLPAAVIFIYRDLLRRQARQTELESRLEAERQISTAREELIANASHELRTPLTSITGLAMLLEEDPVITADPASAELLDLMISESGDLNRMVEDLLTTARLDAGALSYQFRDVNLDEEIAEVIESFKRAGLAVTVDCAPGLARADPVRLRQIMRNLLSNAAKYGGSDISISGHSEGRAYVIDVIDDGDGVPPEISERLFERFVHLDNTAAVRESVGLGLSIVSALAQGMGGSVSYRRIADRTHFAFRLPLAGTEPAPSDPFGDVVATGAGGLDG